MPHVVCFRNFLGAVRNPKTIKRSSYRGCQKEKVVGSTMSVCHAGQGSLGGAGGVQAC